MARGNDVQLGGITDLVLMADIKAGFVDALEVVTYVDRLRKVLRTLNGLRLGSRESSSPASPYTDIVGRWRIVHSFRWAVIEGKDGEPDRLLLSVIFDGGWEPYMRVIWDQLGSTLDLILCHTEDYELSCHCSFETYSRWVRDHETSADFLFISSGRTVADTEYLARLEASQRGHADELKADRLRAPSSGQVPALPTEPQDRFAMAVRGLVPLAGLYTLQRYFRVGAPDGQCLLRATKDVLFELARLDTKVQFPATMGPLSKATPDQLLGLTPQQKLAAAQQVAQAMQNPAVAGPQLRLRHHEMLAWFETPLSQPKPKVRQLQWDSTQLQAGMLAKPPANRGALLLLRIEQPTKALAWLATAPVQHEGQDVGQDVVWRQVALSLAGLKALGIPASRLDRFPQAFKEGMAARAGLLGDTRHNHPAHWALAPHINGRDRFDPAGAHLLVQIRFTNPDGGEALTAADEERIAATSRELTTGTGLALMAIEPMRSNLGDKENFGYADGISQPNPGPVEFKKWNDEVPIGELLQGFPTLRDKGYPVPEQADALLDRGSFLAVRKLRQYTGRLHDCIDGEAKRLKLPPELLMSKLMGRKRDGKALADESTDKNDFNYEHDGRGAACPFHSHIRRANPRDQDPNSALFERMPRILRRGMSYGPPPDRIKPNDKEDRGLVFMAYNAHLAEQFEVVQRWIAGSNASGGYSAQSDPLLGVADASLGDRIYPFEHAGDAHEVNLGNQPFVTLQWGAYFFVPSIPALKALPALAELPLPLPAPTPVPVSAPAPQDKLAWQRWLEDTTTRDEAWAWVRAQPGGVAVTAYGTLVGAAGRVQDVLRNQPARYSVKGYGERMRSSIGEGFLGMDDDNGHKEQAPAVNKAIEEISELEAFTAAYKLATVGLGQLKAEALGLLGAFPADQRPNGIPADTPLDLERLSEGVLAALCQHWFGLPDHRLMLGTESAPPGTPASPEPARCPRSLIRVSRHVFGPCPSAVVSKAGEEAGQAFLAATTQWLQDAPRDQWPALTKKIVEAAEAVPGAAADLPARTLAGAMLGFPPTTHGNLLTVLAAWVQTRKLWELQPIWHEVPEDASDAQRYSQAVARLRPMVIATMNLQPTPYQLWRRVLADHRLGEVDVKAGDTLVLGLGSATQQDPLRHHVVFGGDCADPAGPPPHACPGYAMGMGVMLGVIAAVLDAGVMRFTGAPTVVALAI